MGDISKDIKTTFPNHKVKAILNIIYTANWISSIQNEFFKPYGISPQQFNILRILRGAGKAINVQTIKDRMLERAPNATRLMDKLCDKNLIKRTRCENDRRVVYIKISEKGLKLLNKINSEEFDNQMNAITEEEAKLLNKLLSKIR